MNKLLNKLSKSTHGIMKTDRGLFDCHGLPQQGCNGATGFGAEGAGPLCSQVVEMSVKSKKPVTS
jgi:hypothetical protein